MTRDLSRLLRPKSIAVIGGGFFAPNVVKQCVKMGFAGDIWPVHPTKDEIAGVRAYASLADLPGAPDATFIGVNRDLTVDMVRELRARGAGGAICFAAGFKETGAYEGEGERLQAALIEAAGDMPVIGPNCYGLINYADGALLWPDQHGGRRLAPGETGAAIITQSSNIAINLTMQQRGLPLAYLLTAGNQAQTGLSEMALGLIEDSRVTCLGLHIEGFDSVSGFERLAARARELQKPVVAMKVGRSEAARAATISHTASLAGSDAASDAFLRRLGIARVNTIPSFLETLKLLHAGGPLGGRRLSSMSCSGGEASVMADAAEGRRVHFPALSNEHRARVEASLGPLVAVANPLDYNTYVWGNEPAMVSAFGAMISGGFDLNMLVLDFPRPDRCSDTDWWPTVKAFETALKAHGARGAIVASMGENLSESHAEDLLRRGIVPLAGIAEAMDVADAAAMIGEAWGRPSSSPLWKGTAQLLGSTPPPPPSAIPLHRFAEVDSTSLTAAALAPPRFTGEGDHAKCGEGVAFAGSAIHPDEAQAKQILRDAGLPVPPGRRASGVEEAVAIAEAIGYPVALKALGLAHKSEHGAVRLNLHDATAVANAARGLLSLGTGLMVERMIEGGAAELIVGVTRDSVFGPVMTIGCGGVLVELLKDSATLLLPVTAPDVDNALRGLKMFPLLDGYRGRPKADVDAAVRAILGIADFALANATRLAELDINPLIVCAEGAWVADALMVFADPS